MVIWRQFIDDLVLKRTGGGLVVSNDMKETTQRLVELLEAKKCCTISVKSAIRSSRMGLARWVRNAVGR